MHALHWWFSGNLGCPCGFLGDSLHACRCSTRSIESYRQRISGPLLDRIDIHLEVPRVSYRDLAATTEQESSACIKQRVDHARSLQLQRFSNTPVRSNASMSPRQVKTFCRIDSDGHRLMEMVVERLGFSARAYAKILKVARTIADLEGSQRIRAPHLAEAVQYRTLDRGRQTSAA